MSAEQYLEQIKQSYEKEMGEITNKVQFRRAIKNVAVPTELDILFWLPGGHAQHDELTIVATAGMGYRLMPGEHKRIELAYEIKGNCALKLQQQIAKHLAELAVVPFLEKHLFHPNMILDDITLPPFYAMQSVVLSQWDIISPTILYAGMNDVFLVRAIPVYASEASIIEKKGAASGVNYLRNLGLDMSDYKRGNACE